MSRAPRFPNPKLIAARAAVCGAVLILPSCQIPKLQQAAPGTILPAAFNPTTNPTDSPAGLSPVAAVVGGVAAVTAPPPAAQPASDDTSARIGVDEFFNDPFLSRLIAQAMDGNQELRGLDQEIQIANNEVLARRGAYLPFVGFRGGSGLDKPSLYTRDGAVDSQLDITPGREFPSPLGDHLFGLNFLWQLDIWRELRNARDAAGRRYLAAVDKRNFFVTRLVAEVGEGYYELLALDQRMIILDQTIALQEQSLKVAEANKEAARGTELGVQRFLAEVRRNQSEKLIVRQQIVEVENRINFLAGRYPQPVERATGDLLGLTPHPLALGVPSQLLQNRPDVRQAERELEAAGLDVKVARARFFPRIDITGGVGYQAFVPRYLFNPDALAYNLAGELTAPLVNKKAIQADYLSANARQLQAVYNYQRVVLNAFTEVVNRVSRVENYRQSVEIKKDQLKALEESVVVASRLFQRARAEYVDVLFAQRDLRDARIVTIETKQQQLSAVVSTYQALGGGLSGPGSASPVAPLPPVPRNETEASSRPTEGEPLTAPRPDKVAP